MLRVSRKYWFFYFFDNYCNLLKWAKNGEARLLLQAWMEMVAYANNWRKLSWHLNNGNLWLCELQNIHSSSTFPVLLSLPIIMLHTISAMHNQSDNVLATKLRSIGIFNFAHISLSISSLDTNTSFQAWKCSRMFSAI